MRALKAGSILATRLNDPGAATYYYDMAERIANSTYNFWHETDEDFGTGLWNATIFDELHHSERTGLDCALPLLGVQSGIWRIEEGDGSLADRVSRLFHGGRPALLATLREDILSFADLYKINERKQWKEGWAVGRYKEDVYDGTGTSKGNPWSASRLSILIIADF